MVRKFRVVLEGIPESLLTPDVGGDRIVNAAHEANGWRQLSALGQVLEQAAILGMQADMRRGVSRPEDQPVPACDSPDSVCWYEVNSPRAN